MCLIIIIIKNYADESLKKNSLSIIFLFTRTSTNKPNFLKIEKKNIDVVFRRVGKFSP